MELWTGVGPEGFAWQMLIAFVSSTASSRSSFSFKVQTCKGHARLVWHPIVVYVWPGIENKGADCAQAGLDFLDSDQFVGIF